jgi:beta-phosphoglucomutase-like phosphatase (HAD superfamily)
MGPMSDQQVFERRERRRGLVDGRLPRRTRGRVAPRRQPPPAATPQPPVRPSLDALASGWQRALDADERALSAAAGSLSDGYLKQRRRELAQERRQTAELLVHVAQAKGVRPVPWLSPVPVTKGLLGLPTTVTACLFDLDGVLTNSALLHAAAWAKVLDEFLLQLAARTGWQFIPFDRDADYRNYIDGRSRLEGIHSFLESRGIRLAEGRPDDPAHAETAYALARRKGEMLARGLEQRGVTALPGARRYLEAAGHAGLKRAVVSASASTAPMLELAALSTLVDAFVDADVIRTEGVHTPPAPDLLLAACRRLEVRPEDAVTFTHSPAGVVAGVTAGLTVIGVGARPQEEELLSGFGAERTIRSLGVLLDRALVDGVTPGAV